MPSSAASAGIGPEAASAGLRTGRTGAAKTTRDGGHVRPPWEGNLSQAVMQPRRAGGFLGEPPCLRLNRTGRQEALTQAVPAFSIMKGAVRRLDR